MSYRNHLPEKIDAHRHRLNLRHKLLDVIEQRRLKMGYAKSTFAEMIGMCKTTYNRVYSDATVTLDSLVLYLHRLGIQVEIKIIEEPKVEIKIIKETCENGRHEIIASGPSGITLKHIGHDRDALLNYLQCEIIALENKLQWPAEDAIDVVVNGEFEVVQI